MTTLNEKLTKKFERLLAEGKQTMLICGWDGKDYTSRPDSVEYLRFRTEVLNLTRIVCGDGSDHYRELRRISDNQNTSGNPYYYKDCLAVFRAAYQDYVDGLLFDVRAVIAAEVLADFIDQADELLKSGYHVAATSVAGAVLEDAMRKACASRNIPVPEKTTIAALNMELARVGVYDKLVMKRITFLAELRNTADHGHFEDVKPEDARDLVKYIRRFCADHLVRD